MPWYDNLDIDIVAAALGNAVRYIDNKGLCASCIYKNTFDCARALKNSDKCINGLINGFVQEAKHQFSQKPKEYIYNTEPFETDEGNDGAMGESILWNI